MRDCFRSAPAAKQVVNTAIAPMEPEKMPTIGQIPS
jgi:hypothetical protein